MKRLIILPLSIFFAISASCEETKDFTLYGKVALVSTLDLENGSQALGDNSSRLGIKYQRHDLIENVLIGLRTEWSVSTNRNNSGFGSSNFNGKKYDVIDNDGPFGNRLGYLWLQYQDLTISAGKMWSAFYDVPEFTDLFYTDGARASSVYTITGEVDGTYRASEVIQARYQLGNFRFALQTKLTGKESIEYDFNDDGVADSTLVYKQVQAASIIYETPRFSLGLSSINMMFDNNGESESQLTLSYGLKLNIAQSFLHAVYTRGKDLELNTDDNTFVHSDGVEVILGHRFTSSTTFMLGLNHQKRTESADFELLYYYASLSKTIKALEMAIEYIHGDSTNADGSDKKEKLLKLAASLYF